ncbi:hypothetical protein BDF22DRAFT_773066 [Syncephalis plumigaleata]|nr:hypothetical protein BDF22DRAFT_773066 [Syncephalis plumigaleata]
MSFNAPTRLITMLPIIVFASILASLLVDAHPGAGSSTLLEFKAKVRYPHRTIVEDPMFQQPNLVIFENENNIPYQYYPKVLYNNEIARLTCHVEGKMTQSLYDAYKTLFDAEQAIIKKAADEKLKAKLAKEQVNKKLAGQQRPPKDKVIEGRKYVLRPIHQFKLGRSRTCYVLSRGRCEMKLPVYAQEMLKQGYPTNIAQAITQMIKGIAYLNRIGISYHLLTGDDVCIAEKHNRPRVFIDLNYANIYLVKNIEQVIPKPQPKAKLPKNAPLRINDNPDAQDIDQVMPKPQPKAKLSKNAPLRINDNPDAQDLADNKDISTANELDPDDIDKSAVGNAYSPPEQFHFEVRKRRHPYALDSWAIGIIIYKLLAPKQILDQIYEQSMVMRRYHQLPGIYSNANPKPQDQQLNYVHNIMRVALVVNYKIRPQPRDLIKW